MMAPRGSARVADRFAHVAPPEKSSDAFDGLVGIVRAQGPEAEVACFRERNGGFHGFRIPDFAMRITSGLAGWF